MNKISHLRVTEQILGAYPNLSRAQKKWIRVGCILPDLLLSTYLKAHTWKARSPQVFRMTERFLRHGLHSRRDFLAYGCMLHYVEDFFTFPHNEMFRGSLREHVRYEGELCRYLTRSAGIARYNGVSPMAWTLPARLSELHDNYQNTQSGVQTDLAYIKEAAGMISAVFLSTVCADVPHGSRSMTMVYI